MAAHRVFRGRRGHPAAAGAGVAGASAASTLAGAIQQALPGITLEYDQAAIEWSRDEGRVNLVVLGARIFDANGRVVAQAPKADIDLAARALPVGPDSWSSASPWWACSFRLVHMKDGGIRLGAEGDKGGNDVLARLNDVIKAKGSSTSVAEKLRGAQCAADAVRRGHRPRT